MSISNKVLSEVGVRSSVEVLGYCQSQNAPHIRCAKVRTFFIIGPKCYQDDGHGPRRAAGRFVYGTAPLSDLIVN